MCLLPPLPQTLREAALTCLLLSPPSSVRRAAEDAPRAPRHPQPAGPRGRGGGRTPRPGALTRTAPVSHRRARPLGLWEETDSVNFPLSRSPLCHQRPHCKDSVSRKQSAWRACGEAVSVSEAHAWSRQEARLPGGPVPRGLVCGLRAACWVFGDGSFAE